MKVRTRRLSLAARGGEMAAYDIGPANRPIGVIFSHANGFNARTYLSILEPVAALTRILAIDLRGHGKTSLPTDTEGRTSWDNFKDDLLAVMTETDVENVVLAGHSMGATTSLLAAAAAPGRVRSLVLFDPVIMPLGRTAPPSESPIVRGTLRRRAIFSSRTAAIESYQGRGAFKGWSARMLEDYVEDGFRDLPDGRVELSCAPGWEYSNYLSQAHDSRGAFRDLRRPMRILKAEHHSACSLTDAEALSLGAGRIAMETVAGTSHFLPMERPELAATALRSAVG